MISNSADQDDCHKWDNPRFPVSIRDGRSAPRDTYRPFTAVRLSEDLNNEHKLHHDAAVIYSRLALVLRLGDYTGHGAHPSHYSALMILMSRDILSDNRLKRRSGLGAVEIALDTVEDRAIWPLSPISVIFGSL